MNEKHMQRYVDEFQARNNLPRNAIVFTKETAESLKGRLLIRKQLVEGIE